MPVARSEPCTRDYCFKTEQIRNIVGSVLSPLLANLYMRRFVLGWKVLGHEQRWQARIVNYADDFVICCRGSAIEAAAAMRDMMARLRLTVNESKTRCCRLPEETFTFLGYTFGRCYSWRTGRAYLAPRPARKKVQALCTEISAWTARRTVGRSVAGEVAQLNQQLQGWANYFCLGPVTDAYAVVMGHVRRRLRQWLCAKHRIRDTGRRRYTPAYLHQALGLIDLTGWRGRAVLWANV